MAQDERAQWIERLDTARNATREAVKELTPETEVYPGWLLKDFLAHLTGWQEAAIFSLRAYCRGEEWQIPTFRGLDEHNLSSVETRKDLRFDQVYTEWEMVHDRESRLLELPPENRRDAASCAARRGERRG
jgi:hypothetical protein